MENKKNISDKSSINESSIEKIYTQFFGEYQPDEFSPKAEPKNKTKQADMGEGKLFTKFISNK